ncbi:hypothetical protein ACLI09_17235 [Flavobacterium sp. RHBU_24]|uniref:hypothetical protein n=1 Tax=Flavobacterium sp. RHBU_24 TaxID=3391185 RepID=UPI003984F561
MKNHLIIVALVAIGLSSCDYVLKRDDKAAPAVATDKKVITGPDKDSKGCVTSAGYHWSRLKGDCIRPLEDGYRLNSIEKVEDESPVKSAFVIFSEDKEKAELYMPDTENSILLIKEGNNIYKSGSWSLHADNGYTLKNNGHLVYVGAEPVKEGQVTGDENPES